MMKKCHPCDDLGVTLIGGNAVGIFVHSLHPNMVASSASGLRCGDHILEVSGDHNYIIAVQRPHTLAQFSVVSLKPKCMQYPAIHTNYSF